MKIENFYKNYFGINHYYKYRLKVWQKILKLCLPLFIKASKGSSKTEAVLVPFGIKSMK